MKKLSILVAFILVAIVAFYLGDQHGMSESDHMTGENATEHERGVDGHDPRITASIHQMSGVWSSEDDRNFQREYRADGTLTDNYASGSGKTLTNATWSIFTADTAREPVDFQLNEKDLYIKQIEKDGAVTYFRVISLTPQELELVNMTKGGGLRFGKMTTGHELQD